MPTVFFSYSHKDENLRDELEVHLSMLKREGLIDAWHDRRISAGDDFAGAIDSNLNSSDLILLLISPDFLASAYCYDVEVKRAMERHERGDCRVIPVILRPSDWKNTPFAKLLVTPTDGKPITKWPDRDEAFLNVAQQIRSALPRKGVAASVARMPVEVGPTAIAPRSSNLRLRKQFTEAARDRFLDEAFDFIMRFFENSLSEIEQRNEGIETRFNRLDARAFGAVIYRNGTAVSRCGVRRGGARGFGSGIAFSYDESAPANSMNESLSVETSEQSLFLKPMGMAMLGKINQGSHLSHEGAAEYYWSLLVEPLQR